MPLRPIPPTNRGWQTIALAGVAALTLTGVAVVSAASTSNQEAEPGVCIASGVAVPENQDCPVLTPRQDRLIKDIKRAKAAADQATIAADGDDDPQVTALVTAAQEAADRAAAAGTDAQIAVAEDPTAASTQRRIQLAARRAKTATDEAVGAAVRVNAAVQDQH